MIEIDTTEIKDFVEKLGNAPEAFKEEVSGFMESFGIHFLNYVQDEIIRRRVMDSRLLLASFSKGNAENVWELSDGGFKLEIGTNVKYAAWVNDGHRQTPGRFIPGYWQGNRFVYEPGASSGMVLKASWVEGKHYWEGAINIMERVFPGLVEEKFKEWINNYFG